MFYNDYDPYESQRQKEFFDKFAIFIFQVIFLCVSFTRLYMLLFWFLGCCVVAFRAYLTSRNKKGKISLTFIQEIGCAWKSGELTNNIVMFWPLELLITLVKYFLTHSNVSFSRSYELDKSSAYNSGRGKFHGIHADTAMELTKNDVQEAQIGAVEVYKKVEDTGILVRKQSRLALIYSSMIGFLAMPLSWFWQHEEGSKDVVFISALVEGPIEKNFFDFKALIDNSFDLLVSLFKKFFIFLVAIISFCQKILPIRKILWYLIRPIRAIPVEWLRVTNQINAPPVYVLANSHHTRILKLGGNYEVKKFDDVSINNFYY